MSFVGDSHKSGKFFALSAGDEHNNPIGRITLDFFDRNNIFWIEKLELLDNFKIGLHRAAFNSNFLIKLVCSLDDADDAFNLRSKGADDHAASGLLHYFLDIFNNDG